MSDEIPKLRMAPRETAEELALRYERETRRVLDQREDNLEGSLAPFRVGSVPYLNAVPLTRGLEDQIQFVVPSKLAQMLQRDELDAALVSITKSCLTIATIFWTASPLPPWAKSAASFSPINNRSKRSARSIATPHLSLA